MRLLLLSVSLFLTSCARPAGGSRIAVVDVQRVVRESQPGVGATRQLEESKAKLQAALNAKQTELRARMAALESSPQKDPVEAERIREALVSLKSEVEQQNADLEAQQRALVDGLLVKVAATVRSLGTQEQFSVILDRENVPFIGTDTVDLTERCIVEVNKLP